MSPEAASKGQSTKTSDKIPGSWSKNQTRSRYPQKRIWLWAVWASSPPTHPPWRVPFIYHAEQRLIVFTSQTTQAIFDSVESGLVVLISQCTHSDGNETLQHKLRVGGEKKDETMGVWKRFFCQSTETRGERCAICVGSECTRCVWPLNDIKWMRYF